MRLTIPTTGSRGDVQPYVALGLGLRAAGHEVRIASHADFGPLVRGHGLDFHAIEDNGRDLQAGGRGDRMLRAGGNPVVFLREYIRLREPLIRDMMARLLEACRDADALLLTNTASLLGLAVAEKLDIPTFQTSLQPAVLTRHQTNFLLPEAPDWLPLRGLYNLASHLFAGLTLWGMWRPTFNAARAEVLGLPSLPRLTPGPALLRPSLCLNGYSPLIVPRPRDWPAAQVLTGYWFLDHAADWRPPAELEDFLASGPPPVYVGFGSNHNRDAAEVTDLVVRALKRAGVRGLLLTGWGGLEAVSRSDQFFPLESAPHSWLFPRTAAVVHHGGAGSTAAGLRAGVPSVVVPFMADQPFWGGRVHRLGAGTKPIPRAGLTAARLESAVRRAVTDPAIRQRAAALGRLLRTEDGVGTAVGLFQDHIGAWTEPAGRGAAAEAMRVGAA